MSEAPIMENNEEGEPHMSPSQLRRAYFYLLLTAASVITLDQWTKALVRDSLAFGETWTPWASLAPYARIINWHNEGAAFGLFQGGGGFFAILAVVVAGLILYYFPRIEPRDWLLRFALGMQLGGALGNLVDRVLRGYVTDFVSVGTFPVFNVADASITVGAGALLLLTFLAEREEKKAAAQEQDARAG